MPVRNHSNRCVIKAKALLQSTLLIIFCVITFKGSAQQKFSGRLTGIANAPLFGAAVRIKSSNQGVIADENGFFEVVAKEGECINHIQYWVFISRH
jgi:hypothetical protein